MGCCAGKLQFHKETKRQDKNEYLAAARAVETGAGLTKDVHMDTQVYADARGPSGGLA